MEEILNKKLGKNFPQIFWQAIYAGVFVAFAATGYIYITAATICNPAVTRAIGGLMFSFGLVGVVCGGGELFTGNILLLRKPQRLGWILSNWAVVLAGNALGALLVYGLIQAAVPLPEFMHKAQTVADMKVGLAPAVAFARGIGCNFFVCLAVLMASKTEHKVITMLLPITLFILMGMEHSVANLFVYWYASKSCVIPLIMVVAGNIVGGALIVPLIELKPSPIPLDERETSSFGGR